MNSDSDLQIAGDILEVPHLLQAPREHPATVAEFAGLVRSLAADPSAWRHLVRYDATTRWYHRLRTGPGYEVWLLSWLPGQGSGRHDHGPSSGVWTVLEGTLTEHTERGTRALRPGTQKVFARGTRTRWSTTRWSRRSACTSTSPPSPTCPCTPRGARPRPRAGRTPAR